MKTYRFESQLWLPQARDQIFKFFADPRNLQRLTPEWLRFEILTPPAIEIRQATLLDYRLRLRGMPLRWQSEIAVWEPPIASSIARPEVPTRSGCTNTLLPRRTMAPLLATKSNMPSLADGSCRNISSRPI